MLSAVQRAFLDRYRQNHQRYVDAAKQSRDLINAILSQTGVLIHTTEARAKKPDSLQWKLFVKNYKRPTAQISDLVGVRVILFYDTDIEPVANALREELNVIRSQSIDKRRLLGHREFGYRSLHLVVKLKGLRMRAPEYRNLANETFEIQIRTVLDHAWAEIEHEVVYKSGIDYPNDTLRRFASIAGSLEILGREFRALRDEKRTMIDGECAALAAKFVPALPLDVIRLCALLEIDRPRAPHFCDSHNLPSGIEKRCLELLKRVGIGTIGRLRTVLKTKTVRRAIQEYAAENALAANMVPDLAVLIIVIRLKNQSLVTAFFPDYIPEQL